MVTYNGASNDKTVILLTVGAATPTNVVVQQVPAVTLI